MPLERLGSQDLENQQGQFWKTQKLMKYSW